MMAMIPDQIARSLFMTSLLTMGMAAAQEPAYTPVQDLSGSWSYTRDPKLPNVLILGDSISIGYTRLVRRRLLQQVNIERPMDSERTPANCGDTRAGLAHLKEWLGGRKWDVIYFNWGLSGTNSLRSRRRRSWRC